MSFNYDIDYDIDRGWTTRTISGSLRIAQTRLPANAGAGARIADTADSYREWIRAGESPPNGFERRSKWTTSEDKSTLTFSIVDTQIRGTMPRPPGVVDISGDHTVSWRRAGKAGGKQSARLSMDIELLPTIPKITGFMMFSQLLQQKVNIAKSTGQAVLVEELQVREDIWGMVSSYSAGYTIYRGIDEIIQASGVFVAPSINSASWESWSQSVKSANGQRGYIGMRDFAANDIIVDMCTQQVPTVAQGPTPSVYRRDSRPVIYKNERPPPEKSYSAFTNAITIHKSMPAVRQSPSQYPYAGALGSGTGGSFQGSIVPPLVASPPNASNGTTFESQERKTYDDTIQLSGGANCTVTMEGYCERAGYEVPRPRIIQIGDLTVASGRVVETNVIFKQAVKCVYFGVPVIQAAWSITYMLTNTPSYLQTPHNIEDFGASQWIG